MAKTTETVLDTTPNKKWSIVAVRKENKNVVTNSSVSFKIVGGETSGPIRIKRVSKDKCWAWEISCKSFQLIPKYVRLFIVDYFNYWFYPAHWLS